jgi:hypothetical protein
MLCAVQLHGYQHRRVAVAAGVLEQLTVVLAALLNLSTLRSNQPKLARRGLQVLLKSNTSLYQIIGSRVSCVHVQQLWQVGSGTMCFASPTMSGTCCNFETLPHLALPGV